MKLEDFESALTDEFLEFVNVIKSCFSGLITLKKNDLGMTKAEKIIGV